MKWVNKNIGLMIVLSYYGDDMLILYLNLSVNDTYISILYV